MKPGALLYSNTSGIDIDIMANVTKRPQDVAGTHFFAPANVMKLFEVVKGSKSAPDVLATAMALGRKIGKVSRDGRQRRRLSSPTAAARRSARRWASCSRKAPARAGRQGHGRFRLPDGAVRGVGDLAGSTSAMTRRQRRAAAEPELPQAADRRPHRRGRAARAEDRRRLVSLREGRPHPASRPRGRRASSRRSRPSSASRSASFTDEEILQPAAVRLGQRGLQDPRRGQGATRQRHRRDVAARLRLPALSRRADVLGRQDRRARGLQPDRRLASAIRRALGAVADFCAASPKPARR